MSSYGDGKSASEMLFSYGFVEPHVRYTSGLILDLTVPEDDPLRRAKEAASTEAAAVRISSDGTSISWDSLFLWLICVNEEDGLMFQEVPGGDDGEKWLATLWKNQNISDDTGQLKALLAADPLSAVFRLRAITILQQRVQRQIQRLGAAAQTLSGLNAGPRSRVSEIMRAVGRLQSLELDLLEAFSRQLTIEVRKSSQRRFPPELFHLVPRGSPAPATSTTEYSNPSLPYRLNLLGLVSVSLRAGPSRNGAMRKVQRHEAGPLARSILPGAPFPGVHERRFPLGPALAIGCGSSSWLPQAGSLVVHDAKHEDHDGWPRSNVLRSATVAWGLTSGARCRVPTWPSRRRSWHTSHEGKVLHATS